MFERFSQAFPADPGRVGGGAPAPSGDAAFDALIAQFGGMSFADGLYRVIAADELASWDERVRYAFPHHGETFRCFGYDWQGNAFAIDPEQPTDRGPGVVLFDIGAEEVMLMPANAESFHDQLMIEDPQSVLISGLYSKWRKKGGPAPGYSDCIGCKKPGFLGGNPDSLKNYELTDLDVHWHILGQVIRRTKGLAD